MSHLRVSQSLNLRFGVFTVLLFHTVLLGLIHPCRGQHRVISPSKLIVAPVGEDIILPSLLDPPMDAFSMTVEWTRPDLDPRFVLVWRDSVEIENIKHSSYVGRASVFTDELKHGNVSLKLSKVKISDGGTYRCFIPDFNIVSTVQLVVGQPQVVGPAQPIVALVGEDIILPSLLDPPVNTFGMTVEWTRPDLDPRFVLVWRDGVELENKKHPSYVRRASVFIDELKRGNVSLKLSEVKISDGGTYRCFIPDFNIVSTVQLVAGAASSPVVQMTRNISAVILQCESKGWYPEPELLWLDGEGHVLSAGPTETVRGPDGLYTVSSRVTVEKRHRNNFTCRVQQKNITQTRETQIYISDYFFDVQSSSAPAIITLVVLLAFCIVFIFAVFFFVCKWRRKISKITRSDEEAEEDRDRALLKTDETEEMNVLGKREKQKSKPVGNRNLISSMSSLNPYQCFKDEHQRREEAERELTEEKQRIETERQQLQKELETMRTEVDKLTAEVKKLTEEKLKSENERQKMQTELETKTEELSEEKKNRETEQQELQTKLGNKETKLKEEKKLQEEKNKVEKLKEEKEKIEKELQEQKKELQKKTKELEKLKEEKQRSKKELKKKLENKENEVQKLTDEKKKIEKELQEQKKKLEKKTNEVQKLKEEKEKIEKKLGKKTNELTEQKKD